MKTKYIIPTNKVVPLAASKGFLNNSTPPGGDIGFDKPDIIITPGGNDDFGDLFN